MINPKLSSTLLAVGALIFCGTTQAALMTIDPSSYASGTDISSSYAGAHLSTLTLQQVSGEPYGDDAVFQLEESAVYSMKCSPCAASTNGQSVFTPQQSYSAGDFYPAYNFADKVARYIDEGLGTLSGAQALKVSFDNPTNYVQVIGGGANTGNFFRVDFWSTTSQLLGTCTSMAAGPVECSEIQLGSSSPDSAYTKDQWSLSFSSLTSSIAYITTGGWGGGQYVRSVAYESGAATKVPEPGALGMLLIGLLGAAARTFKRRGI